MLDAGLALWYEASSDSTDAWLPERFRQRETGS